MEEKLSKSPLYVYEVVENKILTVQFLAKLIVSNKNSMETNWVL